MHARGSQGRPVYEVSILSSRFRCGWRKLCPFAPGCERGAYGLEECATQHHYTVLISDLHDEPAREEASINLLLNQRVEGIIYAGFGEAAKRLEALQGEGVPVVVVDKPLDSPSLSSVLIDNRASVFTALRHLKALGYEDLVFINGLAINRNAQLRTEAFRDFLNRHGMPQAPDQVLFGDYTLQHGFQATRRILQEKRPCRAIFCGDDTIAFGVMAALKAAGRRIPEDVAVLGFDNDPLAQVMDPPLPSLRRSGWRPGVKHALCESPLAPVAR